MRDLSKKTICAERLELEPSSVKPCKVILLYLSELETTRLEHYQKVTKVTYLRPLKVTVMCNYFPLKSTPTTVKHIIYRIIKNISIKSFAKTAGPQINPIMNRIPQ